MIKKDPKEKRSVLFVCAANQCRSPMAKVLFSNLIVKKKAQSEDWRIESAGVWAINGFPAADFAIRAMRDIGLDLKNHHSRPVTESLLEEFCLVLCMENEQASFLKRNFPLAKDKFFLLSELAGDTKEIQDPVGHSMDIYRNTVNEMLALMEKGLNKILDLTEN